MANECVRAARADAGKIMQRAGPLFGPDSSGPFAAAKNRISSESIISQSKPDLNLSGNGDSGRKTRQNLALSQLLRIHRNLSTLQAITREESDEASIFRAVGRMQNITEGLPSLKVGQLAAAADKDSLTYVLLENGMGFHKVAKVNCFLADILPIENEAKVIKAGEGEWQIVLQKPPSRHGLSSQPRNFPIGSFSLFTASLPETAAGHLPADWPILSMSFDSGQATISCVDNFQINIIMEHLRNQGGWLHAESMLQRWGANPANYGHLKEAGFDFTLSLLMQNQLTLLCKVEATYQFNDAPARQSIEIPEAGRSFELVHQRGLYGNPKR